ncbi:uncharacterized protein VTP21DRAFT_6388 [Calcarisporiella thermophila]|uniref:uncharacterized protein n=1 Tax=Calcarisporiella thermophila TaxID=911321 RepID=UPI0037441CBC
MDQVVDPHSRAILEPQLKTVLLQAQAHITPSSTIERESRWEFVLECLGFLSKIQDLLVKMVAADEKQAHSDRDLLGVRDLRVVNTLIEIVVIWGVYPSLLPGVGVPISMRSQSAYASRDLLIKELDVESSSQRRLLQIMETLSKIILSIHGPVPYTTISSLLLDRYLTDILSGLLQLAHGPVEKQSTETEELVQVLSESEHKECLSTLEGILQRVNSFRAMESLMLLLGSSSVQTPPNWLRSASGRYLSQILLKPDGVYIVLEFMVGDNPDVTFPQLDQIAKLLLSVPSQAKSGENYYGLIFPQLVDIIQRITDIRSPKLRAATYVVARMANKSSNLTKKLVVSKLAKPFWLWWGFEENVSSRDEIPTDSSFDPVIASEEELSISIYSLHRCLVGNEPSPILMETFLERALAPLYDLYSTSLRAKLHPRQSCLELLSTYFRVLPRVEDLRRIIWPRREVTINRPYFAPGPTGGAELRVKCEEGGRPEVNVEVIVGLLQDIGNDELMGDFFINLLNEYMALQKLKESTESAKILSVLNIVLYMTDNLGPTILKRPFQIISFACSVLESVKPSSKNSLSAAEKEKSSTSSGMMDDLANIVSPEESLEAEIEAKEDDEEILSLALSLLTAVLHDNEILSEQDLRTVHMADEQLQHLLNHPAQEIRQMARDLRVAISARLASTEVSSNASENSLRQYREAMRAIQDELLPVRAHGMAILRQMVLNRDPLVDGKEADKILNIFVQMVQDEDSFIYLNAVKGLSAMTDIHGENILIKLGEIYCDSRVDLDVRLRVGEALLQTVQRCGDALAKYANVLLNPLMHMLRNAECTHLRSSTLSILGCACETSPLAVSPRYYDLIEAVASILNLESAVEVQRAATMLVLSLIRGLSTRPLQEFPADLLRRIIRLLRYLESDIRRDELVRHQARVALTELDEKVQEEMGGVEEGVRGIKML